MKQAEGAAPAMTGGAQAAGRQVGMGELFRGFLKIGLLGFGGCAPVARHVIVEDRRWLTEQEYASVLALGQVIPGGNLVNVTVMLGDRFQGPLGALVALVGFTAAPLAIMIALGAVVHRFAGRPVFDAAVSGVATVAALSWVALSFTALALVAVGLLRMSLLPVVLVLAPISIAVAWWRGRR